MTPILAHLQPYDIAAAARIDVRLGDAGNAEAYGLGGVSWSPYLIERPVWSLEMMAPELDGKVQAGRARLTFNPLSMPAIAGKRIKWKGAVCKIYSAADLAWPAVTEFDGEVLDSTIDDDGIVSLTMEVKTDFLEGPLLTAEYTGGGGATGEAGMRGTLKPAGFGDCENIEPIWFDTTRWIGCIDGYGNTSSITKLMEGLDDRGAAVANYANYAALAAAITGGSVPPGRWATCVAEGLVGLGAPPAYPIGVNATFGTNRIGALMRRILETHRGVATGDIVTADFTAMDSLGAYPTALWTKDQRDCKDLLEAMAGSINATLIVTFQKKVSVTRGVTTGAVAELVRSGRTTPRVIDTKRLPSQTPIFRLKARTARPANVLTYDQVLYDDTIEDMGAYNGATVYRKGQVVWSADKSSWLYINATPSSGNAPPAWPTTSTAYWQNLSPPAVVTWANVAYSAGKPTDNAGTANFLSTNGSFSQLTGNKIEKFGGTHGSYQGGAYGEAIKGAAFVSARPVQDNTWSAAIGLDVTTAGNFNPNAAGVWCVVIYSSSTGSGTISLYKGGTYVNSWGIANFNAAQRVKLCTNDRRMFIELDGLRYGGNSSAYDVTPGTVWIPKIFDFYNTGNAGNGGIQDIQYGIYNDAKTFLDDGATVLPQTDFYTPAGVANSVVGQQALATKANVDLSTSDVVPKGSIPPMVPDGALTFTSNTTSINFTWAAFTVYRPDGTTLSVASGSQNYPTTGTLPSSFQFRFYPYVTESTGVLSFVSGGTNSYGTPAIGYTSGGHPTAASQMYLQGRVPMGPFSASTTSSGSGGGSGGGSNCIHEDTLLGNTRAGDVRPGDMVPTPDGLAEVLQVAHYSTARWIEIFGQGGRGLATVTPGHLFYLAKDKRPIRADEVKVGDILLTHGEHVEIQMIKLDEERATAVGILLEDPHVHFVGPRGLLCHNGNQKP